MPNFVRRYLPWVIVGGVLYVLMSYHFIFFGKIPKMLKKSKRTLNYTVFNISGKKNDAIMKIDELRKSGIGELLVEMGRMSEAEYEKLMDKYEGE